MSSYVYFVFLLLQNRRYFINISRLMEYIQRLTVLMYLWIIQRKPAGITIPFSFFQLAPVNYVRCAYVFQTLIFTRKWGDSC